MARGPGGRNDRLPIGGNGILPAYVTFVNAYFPAVAVSWAEVIGTTSVFRGAVAEDSFRYLYCVSGLLPCLPSNWCARERVSRTNIEIVTPVISMRKWEIVKRGMELGAPLDRSWSCSQFEDAACGECALQASAQCICRSRNPRSYRVSGPELRDNNEPRG